MSVANALPIYSHFPAPPIPNSPTLFEIPSPVSNRRGWKMKGRLYRSPSTDMPLLRSLGKMARVAALQQDER